MPLSRRSWSLSGFPKAALVWLLAIQLLLPSGAVWAASVDGSTLPASRGNVSAGPVGTAVGAADLFTGSATYALPIEVPVGTGGLTPQLTLAYSSSGPAESWVGSRWSLGLPTISRSLKFGVPSYIDSLTVFELDGEELVPDSTDPDRYHTRRQSFVKIVHEPDDTWTVTQKDGVVATFGLTADSVIENAQGQPFQWLLSRQEDLHGNIIEVSYDRSDPGTAYLHEIVYTKRRDGGGGIVPMAAERVIEFVLEPRDDAPVNYTAGFQRILSQRLDRIDISVGGTLIRRYDLEYGYSPDSFRTLLEHVHVFGVDAEEPGSESLTTSFSYHSNVTAQTTGWEPAVPWNTRSGMSLVDASRQDKGVRLGDVDGDGLPDLIKAFVTLAGTLETGTWTGDPDNGVYRNNGAGFDADPSSVHVLPNLGPSNIPFYLAADLDGQSHSSGFLVQDVTGDGRVDLLGNFLDLHPTTGVRSLFSFQDWYEGSGNGFLASGLPAALLEPWWGFSRNRLIDVEGVLPDQVVHTRGQASGHARLADLDGDGLPEIIVRGRDLEVHFEGGPPPWWPGLFNLDFCTDLVHSNYFYNNIGSMGFVAAPRNNVIVNATGNTCLDEDGIARIGVSYQHCDQLASLPDCVLRTNFNLTDVYKFDGFGSEPPSDYLWGLNYELGVVDFDLNGDGLADTLSATLHPPVYQDPAAPGEPFSSAWLNDGDGNYVEDLAWALPAGLYMRSWELPSLSSIDNYSIDQGFRFADVNGDGRPDALRAKEGVARATWLNDGDVEETTNPTPWIPSADWEMPADFIDANGLDNGVRLVDVDGDGMTDVLRSFGGTTDVYLNRGEIPDLLTAIDGPFGGSTAFEYRASTEFDNTGEADDIPGLPQVLPVVSRVTLDGGQSPAESTTIEYAGGLFDAARREFRGFREVRVIREADGRETLTEYHQSIELAGLPQSETICERVDDGQSVEFLRWQGTAYTYTDPGASAPYVALPETVLRQEFDGGAAGLGAPACGDPVSQTSRDWLVEFEYDNGVAPIELGNRTAVIEYGEWNGADVDPLDTRRTEFDYDLSPDPLNGDPYLLTLVSARRVLDHQSTVLRRSEFRYDEIKGGRLGELTTREDWLDGVNDPETTFEYDDFGNLITLTTPRANAGETSGSSTIDYDPTYATFPIRYTNELGHATDLFYTAPAACGDGTYANAAAHPLGAGLVQEIRGPNVGPSDSGEVRCYDPQGRIVAQESAGALAKTTWAYDDAKRPVEVTRAVRSRGNNTRVTVIKSDGLGRVIETATDGPKNKSVVAGRVFNAAGQLETETLPHFLGDPAPEITYFYDPLGRVNERRLPVESGHPADERAHLISINQGVVVLTDPNGRETELRTDTFGNVTQVLENSASSVTTTIYEYEVTGELSRVVDNDSNETVITYDSLGRRDTLQDPNAAPSPGPPIDFDYDANGNLTFQTNADGEVISWQYDELDRPFVRKVNAVTDVSWTYDEASVPNGVGRLSSRTEPAGAGSYAVLEYDELGRPLRESYALASSDVLVFENKFDPLGQLQRRTYPTGRIVKWKRDKKGYDTSIKTDAQSAAVVGSIDWDAFGRLTSWTTGNTTGTQRTTAMSYNLETGRLDTIQVTRGGTTEHSLQYGYDGGDRITAITDLYDPTRNQSFPVYDGLDRLEQAIGPYGLGFAQQTLHYEYDALGNGMCLAATSVGGGCPGGTQFTYAGALPHAPDTVQFDGGAVQNLGYTPTGNMDVGPNGRSYGYDAHGQLTDIADSVPASFAYDADGRRARAIIGSGGSATTRYFVAEDFEWDEDQRLAKIHLALDGQVVATWAEPFDPSAGGGASVIPPAAPAYWVGPLAAGGVLGLAALLLLAQLAALRRDGHGLARPALAGGTAVIFLFGTVSPALAQTLPDGDLDGSGALDAADGLKAVELARDGNATSTEIDHGDVAPIDSGDGDLDLGDALLILQAIAGFDADGDGAAQDAEVAAGSNPFLTDTDGDGLSDGLEIALLTDPTDNTSGPDQDSDGDGIFNKDDLMPTRAITYRHADHLRSSVMVSYADLPDTVDRVVYRPFGSLVSPEPAGVDFAFNGERYESDFGIYDYGLRWYDPALGHFLQPDPVVAQPFNPQNLNPYSYVLNQPVNRIDPSGAVSINSVSFFGGGIYNTTAGDIFLGQSTTYFASSIDVSLGYSAPARDATSASGRRRTPVFLVSVNANRTSSDILRPVSDLAPADVGSFDRGADPETIPAELPFTYAATTCGDRPCDFSGLPSGLEIASLGLFVPGGLGARAVSAGVRAADAAVTAAGQRASVAFTRYVTPPVVHIAGRAGDFGLNFQVGRDAGRKAGLSGRLTPPESLTETRAGRLGVKVGFAYGVALESPAARVAKQAIRRLAQTLGF